MKRMIAATIVFAALTGIAFAQGMKDDDPIMMDQKQKKKDSEEIDKKYKSTLDKTRKDTATTHADPWSNMSGADDSKTKR
jgi:hypothetical protein